MNRAMRRKLGTRKRVAPTTLPQATEPAEGPLYECVEGGALGLVDASAFPRLYQPNEPITTAEALAIMEEAGGYPTVPGVRWRLVTSAPVVSLFACGHAPEQQLWFLNTEMQPIGGSGQASAELRVDGPW